MSYTLAWILKCLKLYPSISLIDDSAAATQPLSRSARVADAATQPLCQSGWSSHSATLPEWLMWKFPPLRVQSKVHIWRKHSTTWSLPQLCLLVSVHPIWLVRYLSIYRKARNSCLSHACVLKICFPPSKCNFQEVMPMSCPQPKSPSKCSGNLCFILINWYQ